jgi:ABC-type oligopeptide transport system ATPase subunit
LLFRLGALLTYLLGSIFTDNFTLVFVLTILFLAFDFWTVKNISGRLLVGLRWWNEIQSDGSNKWVFESASVKYTLLLIHAIEYLILTHITYSQVELIMQQILDSSGGCYMEPQHYGHYLHYPVFLH